PLRARDLRTVQAARHANLDALGADPHRVRDRPPHRAAELHAALELLRDALGDELRVELRLPDLGDVEPHVLDRHAEQLRDFRPQLLDVLALLADHDAGTSGVNRDVGPLRRPLDVDAADGCVLELALQESADRVILLHVARKRPRVGIPPGRPVLGDAEPDADRMYFLTHAISLADGYSSPTRTVMWLLRFRMRLPRPFGPARNRRYVGA